MVTLMLENMSIFMINTQYTTSLYMCVCGGGGLYMYYKYL